jgi:hypothetical protein
MSVECDLTTKSRSGLSVTALTGDPFRVLQRVLGLGKYKTAWTRMNKPYVMDRFKGLLYSDCTRWHSRSEWSDSPMHFRW